MFEHKSETEGEEPILKGVLAYIALPSNPSFLGPGTVDEIAERIAKAEGPSGKNADYLFKVCDIVKENGIVDAELEALEERVRAILTRHG
jgi:cation transport regulator ChaC